MAADKIHPVEGNYMDYYLSEPRKKSHVERIALIFTVIALVAVFLADILAAGALAETVGVEAKNMNSDDMVMPQGWRETMFVGLSAVVLGGFYCGAHGAFRSWRFSWKICFMALLVWMGGHTLLAFSGGFQLYEVVHFKGPATWLGLLAIPLGQYRANWNAIVRLFFVFSYLLCGIILLNLATVVVSDRFDMMRAIFGYMQMLQYLALWMLLIAFFRRRFWLWLMPFYIYALGSLLVVTRSLILSCILYLGAALYIAYKHQVSKGRRKVLVYFLGIMAVLSVVGTVFFESKIVDSIELLVARLDDDSRSGQYEQFLSQIDVLDILAGRGVRGVWMWNGVEYSSIDGSYTLMLFTGGFPLLITYIVVMFSAARTCARRNVPADVRASMVTLFFWGLALTGFGIYAVPAFKFGHVVLCLMVGMCISYLRDAARLEQEVRARALM